MVLPGPLGALRSTGVYNNQLNIFHILAEQGLIRRPPYVPSGWQRHLGNTWTWVSHPSTNQCSMLLNCNDRTWTSISRLMSRNSYALVKCHPTNVLWNRNNTNVNPLTASILCLFLYISKYHETLPTYPTELADSWLSNGREKRGLIRVRLKWKWTRG